MLGLDFARMWRGKGTSIRSDDTRADEIRVAGGQREGARG